MATSIGKISTTGERLDLDIRQGATLKPVKHYLKNPDNSPVNLTGYTARGSVRRSALSPDVIATFDCHVESLAGWYSFGMSDEVTANISCGASITDKSSQYEFDIELEDPAGNVQCTFYGPFRVKAEVTKP